MNVRQLDESKFDAYEEAGHAVMYYLIEMGFANKFSPVSGMASATLPRVSTITIEEYNENWGKLSSSLFSLITVSEVLLGGYVATQIKFELPVSEISNDPLANRVKHLLGSYLEEYFDGEASEKVRLFEEIYAFVYEKLDQRWVAVQTLADELLKYKTLTMVRAFEVIKAAMQGN